MGALIKNSMIVLFLSVIVLVATACSDYNQHSATQLAATNQAATNQEMEDKQTNDTENLSDELPEKIVQEISENLPVIGIKDIGFDKSSMQTKVGNKLIFNNTDLSSGILHIIVVYKDNNRSIRYQSPKLDYGQSYVLTINESGTYTFMDLGLKSQQEREMYLGKIIVS